MAIHPSLPGLSVTITVNDDPLPEHADDDPVTHPGATHVVSKYIESVSAQTFAIQATIDRAFVADCPTLALWFYVDGVVVERKVAYFGEEGRLMEHYGGEWVRRVYGARACEGILKMFVFEGIGVAEENNDSALSQVQDHIERLSSVGLIEVKVFRKSKAEKNSKEALFKVDFNPPTNVHEKSLKGDAKSHSTLLGESIPANPQKLSRSDFLDGKDSPLAVFTFKYRSKESLQQLLVVKRTPEVKENSQRSAILAPETPVVEDAMDMNGDADLTPRDDEERRMVAAFLRAKRAGESNSQVSSPGLKRERDELEISRAGVKREPTANGSTTLPARKKRANTKGNDKIDLTTDD